MEVSGQLHARQLYPQGKSHSYLLDRRLAGPQSRFGCGGEDKSSHPSPGLEPPFIQPVAWRIPAPKGLNPRFTNAGNA